MCLFDICVFSLVERRFKSFAQLQKNGFLVFLLLNCQGFFIVESILYTLKVMAKTLIHIVERILYTLKVKAKTAIILAQT